MIKAIIIGCGQIAGGYDEKLEGDQILSHAGAYKKHKEFDIVACIEPDSIRLKKFMEYWDIPNGYTTLNDMVKEGLEFDVASICSPTEFHGAALMQILDTSCQAVLCEKPITDDLVFTNEIIKAYDEANVKLIVNFRRTFLPSYKIQKQKIESGEYGRFLWASASYGKGILHNGGHMLNQLDFFVGPITPEYFINTIYDFFDDDPSISAVLKGRDGGQIHLIASDCRAFHIFETMIVFEKATLLFEEDGELLRVREVTSNPLYPHHKYVNHGTKHKMGLDKSLYWAIDALYGLLSGHKTIPNDGKSAMQIQNLGLSILAMAHQHKKES